MADETVDDLVALLKEARFELNVLGSYADDRAHGWPNVGLMITAKAHALLVRKIDEKLREVAHA